MPPYLAESLAQLKVFEGCVSWMYRDTAGNITVGVGLMLPDAATACALPFGLLTEGQVTGGQAAGGAATAAEIAAEFARVDGLVAGKLPEFYRGPASLELPQPVIDQKLSEVLEGFEATVRAGLSGYDALPDGVKIALLDMAYNLGPEGLLKGYPRMLQAVEAGNWAQAAAECERGGIGAARNAWTSKQFLSAVISTIKAEAETIEHASASWFARLGRWLRGLLRPDR
jgi:GH24 family phage-related lysozyme (muramidase)